MGENRHYSEQIGIMMGWQVFRITSSGWKKDMPDLFRMTCAPMNCENIQFELWHEARAMKILK